MLRAACSLWLLVLCGSAQAQGAVAEPDWAEGTPQIIAQADPETWTFLPDASALRSIRTGLICPASLLSVSLTAVSSQFGGECLYRAGDEGLVWATSMSASPGEARASLTPYYQALESDPELQLEPVEISQIGSCALEIRRMRNVSAGFWISVSDIYAPDALHQFRTAADDESSRNVVETAARELLQRSIGEKCNSRPVS